ncbi:MAG: protein kinase [Elusimicrobia bacterium]|nr:protein kinase [Elusimicrobiota bacterium]
MAPLVLPAFAAVLVATAFAGGPDQGTSTNQRKGELPKTGFQESVVPKGPGGAPVVPLMLQQGEHSPDAKAAAGAMASGFWDAVRPHLQEPPAHKDTQLQESMRVIKTFEAEHPVAGIANGARDGENEVRKALARFANESRKYRSAPQLAWVAQKTSQLVDDRRLASSLATEAIAADPQSPAGYAVRSAVALGQGDAKAAVADARRAVELAPGDPGALALLRQAETSFELSQGRGRQAAERAARLGQGLKSTLASDELVAEGAPLGDARPGRQAPQRGPAGPARAAAVLAGESPRDASRRLVREAQAARSMSDHPRGIDLASRALQLNPRHCDALNVRADLYSRLGQHRQAVTDAGASLAHCPENVPALEIRAHAHNALRLFRPALDDARRATQLNGRSPFGYLEAAEAEEGLGQLRAMAADLRRAAALDRRYLARYEAKAREYDLPIEPVAFEADASLFDGAAAPAAAPRSASASRRHTLLVFATLVGGGLIGLGLLGRRAITTRRRIDAAPAPEPAAGSDRSAPELPFEFRRQIGRGGMGVVFEAWDKSLERRVAIKRMREELRLDSVERDRFLKEARLVASLQHPSIVSIHAVFELEGDIYLVFEFVEGRTLEELLRERGRLPQEEACSLLRPVCEALDYAHAQKIVHRDLKPSNVMVTPSGLVKVMDFGIARIAKDSLVRLSMTNTVAGTPLYMPPEAEDGAVGQPWDVFSLGVVAYELLTGKVPYPAPGRALAKRGHSYARISTIDHALAGSADHAIHAALDPDPDKRPPTATDFWKLLAGQATPPRSPTRA